MINRHQKQKELRKAQVKRDGKPGVGEPKYKEMAAPKKAPPTEPQAAKRPEPQAKAAMAQAGADAKLQKPQKPKPAKGEKRPLFQSAAMRYTAIGLFVIGGGLLGLRGMFDQPAIESEVAAQQQGEAILAAAEIAPGSVTAADKSAHKLALEKVQASLGLFAAATIENKTVDIAGLEAAAGMLAKAPLNKIDPYLPRDLERLTQNVTAFYKGAAPDLNAEALGDEASSLYSRVLADLNAVDAIPLGKTEIAAAEPPAGKNTTSSAAAPAAETQAAPAAAEAPIAIGQIGQQGVPLTALAAVVILALFAILYIRSSSQRDVRKLATSIREKLLADPSDKIWGVERNDAIGEIAGSVQELRQNLGFLQEGAVREAFIAASGNVVNAVNDQVAKTLGELVTVRNDIQGIYQRMRDLDEESREETTTALGHLVTVCHKAADTFDMSRSKYEQSLDDVNNQLGLVVESCASFASSMRGAVEMVADQERAVADLRVSFTEEADAFRNDWRSAREDLGARLAGAAAQASEGLAIAGAPMAGAEASANAGELKQEVAAIAALRAEMERTFAETVAGLNEAVEAYAKAAEAMNAEAKAVRTTTAKLDDSVGASVGLIGGSARSLQDVVDQTKSDILDATLKLSQRIETLSSGVETIEGAADRMDGTAGKLDEIHAVVAGALGKVDEKAERLAQIKSEIVRTADAMGRGADFTRQAMEEIVRDVKKDTQAFGAVVAELQRRLNGPRPAPQPQAVNGGQPQAGAPQVAQNG